MVRVGRRTKTSVVAMTLLMSLPRHCVPADPLPAAPAAAAAAAATWSGTKASAASHARRRRGNLLASELGLENAPFRDDPDSWRRSAAAWQERFKLPLRFKMADGEVVSVEQFSSSSLFKRIDSRRNPRYKSKVERLVTDRFAEKAGVRSAADGISVDPGDTGVTVWDGSLALARYLCHFPQTLAEACAVVELGAGTGLLGCVVARLGVPKVVLTDLPHVLPRLRHAVQINCRGLDVHVVDVEWGHALPPSLHAAMSHCTHLPYSSVTEPSLPVSTRTAIVVLCADLVYHSSAVKPLVCTVEQLLSAGGCGSYALIAQDPHDVEAVEELQQALLNFSCLDLRVARVLEAGGAVGGAQQEQEDILSWEVQEVLKPFPEMMLWKVSMKS